MSVMLLCSARLVGYSYLGVSGITPSLCYPEYRALAQNSAIEAINCKVGPQCKIMLRNLDLTCGSRNAHSLTMVLSRFAPKRVSGRGAFRSISHKSRIMPTSCTRNFRSWKCLAFLSKTSASFPLPFPRLKMPSQDRKLRHRQDSVQRDNSTISRNLKAIRNRVPYKSQSPSLYFRHEVHQHLFKADRLPFIG